MNASAHLVTLFDVGSHAPRGSSSESRHVIHVHERFSLKFTSLFFYFDLSFTILSLFFPLMHFEQHTEFDNLIAMQTCAPPRTRGVTTPTTSQSLSHEPWLVWILSASFVEGKEVNDRSFWVELAGQFPSNLVSMSIVAVCDEGFSLTVWATVFRVNCLKGEETCFLCRNLRLRLFRRVEIVLGETLFFQATDALAYVTFLWRHGASSPASLNIAKTKSTQRHKDGRVLSPEALGAVCCCWRLSRTVSGRSVRFCFCS